MPRQRFIESSGWRRVSGGTCVLGAVVMATFAAPAMAAVSFDRGVHVEWIAPSECPDEEALRAELERLVRVPASGSRWGPHAIAWVTQTTDTTFHLELETHFGLTGRRSLDAEGCEALLRTTALILALSIDPEAMITANTDILETDFRSSGSAARVVREIASTEEAVSSDLAAGSLREVAATEPDDPPTPSPAAEFNWDEVYVRRIVSTSSEPDVSLKEATKRSPRSRSGARGKTRVALRITTGGDIGTLPRIGPGLGGTVAVLHGPLRIEAAVTYWFKRRAVRNNAPSVGADVELVAGDLRGCFAPTYRSLDFAACGGVEAGRMRGVAFGSSDNRTASGPWVAALVTLGVGWEALPWLVPWLQVTGHAALVSSSFVMAGEVEVFRPSPVGARAELGIEVRFP